LQPGRSYAQNGTGYRYGFNGKEQDSEIKGTGNQYDYGFRIYDPRIGKFLSVDPLTSKYPFYSPYQFAGNSPIGAIDIDGLEPKPKETGTKEGQKQPTSETRYAPSDCNCPESEGYEVTKIWRWYSGNNPNRPQKADWYEENEYNEITQDWENGQVLQPDKSKPATAFPEDPKVGGNGRDWNGWQVDEKGYLTGRRMAKVLEGAVVSPAEAEEQAGAQVLKSVATGRAFAKEGEYLLYWGIKEGKPYIGSTTELLGRYTQAEIDALDARVFKFFAENPSVRMPNRGIAIGVEQLIIRLNNAGQNISRLNRGLNLANKINAASKDIYLSEATKWISENIPNWQVLFKLK